MVLASDQTEKLANILDSSWSQSRSFSTTVAVAIGKDKGWKSGELRLENAVQAIKTNRLFFEPGCATNSILGGGGGGASQFPFQDCVVQAIEAANPYIEFRVSMEEMVESYGVIKTGSRNSKHGEKDYDWEYLEGLLSWYLRMNEKKNYGAIVEAFIDVYAGLACCPSSCSFSYNASASSSKSKDWWEININESSFKPAEKELCSN
ncbi:transcription repressor OFP13-like [Humulus lupulus]|uniref:transcription repressor OFP13-like n=1 Tax=Humulus lupulus TaxID=3486 RepID=UPI002B407735|nr:transcription repressor OFP13-like [Humulus lupulus]